MWLYRVGLNLLKWVRIIHEDGLALLRVRDIIWKISRFHGARLAIILYQICTFLCWHYAKYLTLFTPCTACTGRIRRPGEWGYAVKLVSYKIKWLPGWFEWHSWGRGFDPHQLHQHFQALRSNDLSAFFVVFRILYQFCT